jgi:outer membrane lipoprotein carrier protein
VPVVVLLLALLAPPSIEEVVHALEAHYNRLQSLKAEFLQVYRSDAQAPPRQEYGTLFLKKPGKMRWEYARPEVKLFVSDGKTVYFYVPEDRQATRMPVKQSTDLRLPLRFLLGRMDLKREFRIEAARDVAPLDPGNALLTLIPKRPDDRVREILIEVDRQDRIRRVRISETDGTVTEFRLSGEVENPPLENSMFQFHPPPGIEVVEEKSN